MTQKKLTIVDHLLLAARDLSSGSDSFTAEDLVVRAWTRSPDYFGLQGYGEKYPDSNRVLTKIMGTESPLRKRGLLRKVGEKRYQLTDAGRIAADAIDSPAERRLVEMTRSLVAALRRMLESTARQKFERHETLTFGDVCAFWNISPRTSANQFADRRKEAAAAIDTALEHAEGAGGRVTLPGGGLVDSGQLRLLRDLADHIARSFATELQVIEGRRDERR